VNFASVLQAASSRRIIGAALHAEGTTHPQSRLLTRFALFSLRAVPGLPPPSSLARQSPLPTDSRETLRVLLVLLRRHGFGGEL
jgi:hypothetical protein